MRSKFPPIKTVRVESYTIPTEDAEADGTLRWNSTHLTVVHVEAADKVGLGYTFGARSVSSIIRDDLVPVLLGKGAMAVSARCDDMIAAVRNSGRSGISATAISAVDIALWDLKARLLEMPLVNLIGERRSDVAVYGSGGFTNWSDGHVIDQFAQWMQDIGCRAMKMKVGSEPDRDIDRVAAVRKALPEINLMVDANGAYARKQALELAGQFAELGVRWFEEPVSSDDLEGLRLLRDRAPAPIEIAAGEYAYDPYYVRRMLAAGAVDIMQLDATRICGITGFSAAAALADAFHIPISAHTAPAVHVDVCCATGGTRHIEWFHDHVRIEKTLFDGSPQPVDGRISCDLDRQGHGLTFKHQDAECYAA